jgi:DNA-binding transcriptional ArsR family regulator
MAVRRRDLPTAVAKALSHPLRQRLLMVYNEGPSSPSAVAERLDEPLGNVAYHTKRLVEQGCLELVGTGRGLGGVKHTYRATLLYEMEDETWNKLPPALRGSLGGRVVAELEHDVAVAAAVGGFEDKYVHLSRMVLELDERGRRDLSVLLREAVARVDALAELTALRGSERHRSVLAVMHIRTEESTEVHEPSLAL